MSLDSISSAIRKARRHATERKRKTRQVFQDGVVTNPEMSYLKEEFNEAYYELSVLRQMLKQQEDDMYNLPEKDRAKVAEQIEALQKTEKIVFDSYCQSVASLNKAKQMQQEAEILSRPKRKSLTIHLTAKELALLSSMGIMANSATARKLLKVHLTPEELALLYGVVQSSKDLKTRGTDEQFKVTQKKLMQVATLIKNGERNKDVLLAALQSENTR